METDSKTSVKGLFTGKISPLPTIVLILGIVETFLLTIKVTVSYLFVIPRLMQLYQSLGVQVPNPYTKLIAMLFPIIFPIAEIYYGYWLRRLQKGKKELPLMHKRIIYSIFFITFLIVLVSILALSVPSLKPLMLLQQELQ